MARSAFGRRAEPERSEGGWSEAQPNGEGVASGSATLIAKNLKKAISLAKAPPLLQLKIDISLCNSHL